MLQLQLTCLGSFQVTLAGAPLTAFQTDKVRALLVYLALEGRPHQRSDLAQLLWPGYSDESARNSFRQYLHQLRLSLRDAETTPPWLLITRQTVQFNPAAPLDIDVARFQAGLAAANAHPHAQLSTCQPCLAQLRAAVTLYHGDFLAGFSVADSDPFEEWRRITQEQLHLQVLDALTQLADGAEAAGDSDQALQDAQRQLTLEPWLEAAHRRIMRILAQRGQRTAAIAQYNQCRQVMAEELGAAPDAETTALYEQIRAGALEVTKRPSDAVPTAATYRLIQSPNPLLSPLFGRSGELAYLANLLAQPQPRLVTLVGPPGVGKTRLAQASVDATIPHHFVELAAITDPSRVAMTIAQAIGISSSSERSAVDELIEGLRDKTLILVLDNFEQVLAAGALVLRPLLLHCPQLKLLVTSRVALRLQEEQVVPVSPLPLPDLSQPVTAQTIGDNPAVQFFCQQAVRVQPTFQLTDTLAPVVAEICNRLDGLPLALELAAARLRLLSPPMLLARLTNALRLHLLTGGSHNLPPRQQTLRTALAWSYDLLDVTERSIFRQLAIFVGGCTLEAAEAIIGDWRVESGEQATVQLQSSISILDRIDSLLDKNLLRQQSGAGGDLRVVLLETIREYAWELLATQAPQANDALPATRQRHARFFVALVEEAVSKLVGANQVVWLDQLEAEHDNLRAVLDWLEQSGAMGQALQLATQLRYFWRVRGHAREGTERLLRLLAIPATTEVADSVRAHALNATGYLQWVQGDVRAAEAHLTQALTVGRASQEPAVTAFALRYLGSIAAAQADLSLAHARFQESLALYRTLDNPNETALALMYLGDAALAQRDDARAQQLYEESATLLRQLGNKIVLPYALRHLGYLAIWQGDYATAMHLCTESFTLNLAVGERQGSAAALVALAALATAQTQWLRAARLLSIADNWLTASHSQLLPFDQARHADTKTTVYLQLSPSAVASEQTAAQAMTTDEVRLYVRQLLAPEADGADIAATMGQGETREGERETSLVGAPAPRLASIGSTPLYNLPASPTAFVGRARELAEIASRLQTARLLTLVGPGGMGKTRLALETGRQQLAAYADGVWFVALAALTDPTTLASAITTALGVTVQGDPGAALGQFLHHKQLLLILDNFEQLLNGASTGVELVAELLARAPHVRILVTSRERLHLRSEQIYPVQPLEYLVDGPLDTALASASVRLFVQSAQQEQPEFAINAANVSAILRICQLVEGMPLGLELAAASVGVLSVGEIATELAENAEILRSDWVDLPARQRSMRTVFAWSWHLLNDAEQRTVRQIAVFRGGFTRQAAQTVAGTSLLVLTQLIHKSLLQWQEHAEGGGRYVMHELLRQFAAEELDASGERAMVEAQHSRYYLHFVAERTVRLARSEPKEASAEISIELENVRQAWQWATHHGALDALDRSAYALWQFYTFRSLRTEAASLFHLMTEAIGKQEQSPEACGEDIQLRQRLLSKGLALYSSLLIALSKNEQALFLAQQATQLGQAASIEGEALGFLVQGQALRRMGRTPEAQPLLEQAAHLARIGQPPNGFLELLPEVETRAYGWLCSIALTQDHYAEARRYAERHLEVCQRLGKLHGRMVGLTDLVEIAMTTGDLIVAQRYAEEAYKLAYQLGNRWGEAACQQSWGEVMAGLGQYSQADHLSRQSLTSYQQIGDPLGELTVLLQLGRLYTLLGRIDAAQVWFEQYNRVLQAAGSPAREAFLGWLALALHANATGHHGQALALAEQGWQQAQQLDGRANQAYALMVLGLAQESLQQYGAAATAYTQALSFYEALGHRHATVAPRAGLAQLALAQGDRAEAQTQIEALLPLLADSPYPLRTGFHSPYFVYWTAYRALAANDDPRAVLLLQQGHDLLQADAAALDDETRLYFLEIPLHRALLAAYVEHQAQPAQFASNQAQDDKVPSGQISSPPPPPATSSPLHDWEKMPAVRQFHGRARELGSITSWVSDNRCRLVLILGIGGVGKSTLVAQAVRTVAEQFDAVIWSSLLNAPLPGELLRDWLRVLTPLIGGMVPEDEEEQLRLLLTTLRRHRCLLVLDNAESILLSHPETGAGEAQPAGTLRPGYEGYARLLQTLCQETHRSCLLMTSREVPHVLSTPSNQPPIVQMLSLTGLAADAGQALLQAQGLATDNQTAQALVAHYSGNPLALQIVSHTIADLYAGDIAAFTAEGTPIFDDIRTMLDQQVARLSSLECELLLWLAIEREPLTPVTLRNNLVDKGAQRVFLEALRALQRRSLLEKAGDRFTLQNVIIEYLTDRLIEGICAELMSDPATNGQSDTLRGSAAHPFFYALLTRHALLTVSANESVRQSQVRLILHPIAQRLQAKLGKKRLVQQAQRWLDWLRTTDFPHQGYAAGNLLNLLLHLEVDLSGFDFSQLAVWRADLRGAYLPMLDFTGADLTGSMVTHRFGRPGALCFDRQNELMFVDILGNRLRLWRVLDATLCQEVVLPDLPVFNLTLSSDCQMLVFLTSEHRLILADLTGQRSLLYLHAHQHTIWRYLFSPDNRWLISGDASGLVCVWDCQNGQLIQARQIIEQPITALAMTPDGETIATATVDGTIYLWSMTEEKPTQTLQGHTDEVASLTFAQNGTLLIAGSHDTTVGVWDVKRGEWRYRLHGHSQPIRRSFASATGDIVITGGPDPFVYVWDLERGVARHLLAGHNSGVDFLALSPDGKQVAILDRNTVFSLWDAAQGQRIDSYPIYRNALTSVDFSRDGTTLLSGGGDGALYLWQMNDATVNQLIARVAAHKQRITVVAFSRDGQLLASGDDGHLARLWDRASLRLRHTLDGHTGAIDGLAFSPDNRLLASISYDSTVILWSVATGERLHTLTGHTNGVTRCAFSPVSDATGQRARPLLVTGSMDHTLLIWDADRGEVVQRLQGHTNGISGCVFSPDGQRVISTSFDRTWRVWDTQTGQQLASWTAEPTTYIALTYHPTRPILAVSGQDQIIRLLNAETGQPLAELHGHNESILGLRFHPNGQLLASASGDETIKLWDLADALAQDGTRAALQTLHTPGPYAGMQITGVTGISATQKATLLALGAVEN